MTAEPTDLFDAERAQAYDHRIRAAIPGYEALHQLACMIVAEATNGHGRVLVAGAGTGAECVALAQACPSLDVAGVDPAPEMLKLAERKVAEHGVGNRVRLRPGVVRDLPASEPFDCATLLLVLHFLPDDGAKQALLKDIADRLKPGAPLVLADMFGPGWDDPWQSELRAFWTHLQRSAGIGEEDITRGHAHVDRSVHLVTEARLAELCDAAGLTPPLPFFRALCFGGWVTCRKA